jgi:hypothetical protein
MKKVEVIYERFTKDGREVVGSGADKDWLDSNELINTEALTKQVGGDHYASMKQHKWAKEIKAWADGAEIEARYEKANGWTDWKLEEGGFIFYQKGAEYRIKPQPKEPQYLYVYMNDGGVLFSKELNETFKHRYIGKIKLEVDDD